MTIMYAHVDIVLDGLLFFIIKQEKRSFHFTLNENTLPSEKHLFNLKVLSLQSRGN